MYMFDLLAQFFHMHCNTMIMRNRVCLKFPDLKNKIKSKNNNKTSCASETVMPLQWPFCQKLLP